MDGRAWLRGSIAQPHFAIRWITFGPPPRRHTPYPLCCLVSGRFEIRRPPLLHTKATLKAKKVFLSPLAKLKNTQKVNQYNKEPASAFYFWQSKIEILKIENICLYSKASKTLWSILMKLCMRKFVMRTSWGWTCKASDRRILFENNSNCHIWILFFGIFHLHLTY